MLEKLWEIVSQSVDSQRDSSRKENILNGYNDKESSALIARNKLQIQQSPTSEKKLHGILDFFRLPIENRVEAGMTSGPPRKQNTGVKSKILGSGVRGYPREELTAVKDKDKVMKIQQKQAQTNEKRRAVTAVPGLKRRPLQDIACTTSICISHESSAGCNSVPKSLITPSTCLSSLSKRARECYGAFRRETPKSSTTGLLFKKGLEKQTLTDKTHTALGCSNNHVSRTGIGQSESITGSQLCKPSNIEPSPVMTPAVRLRVNPTAVIDGQKQKQDLTKDKDSITYTLDSSTAVSQKAETLATPTNYSMRLGKPFTAHMGNPRPFTPSVVSFNGGGVTPPLCQCGRRTRRRCVVNPGPNQGRAFFTCSFNHCRSDLGSNVGKSKSESGCKFFRWEVRS